MGNIWSLYGMLGLIFISVMVGYGVIVYATNPHVKEISAVNAIRTALRNIGIEKPAWHTLIISATQDIRLPLDKLWETWSRLDGWPAWGSALVASTRWVSGSGWETGAKFEQSVYMGIPAGVRRSVETIEECEPMRRVRWCRSGAGIRSCQIWSFTVLPNGRTRITHTEVFDGTAIGLFKPLLAMKWQPRFDRALTGLVNKTRENIQA